MMRCGRRWLRAVGMFVVWILMVPGSLLCQTVADQPKVDSFDPPVAIPGQRITVAGAHFGATSGTLWAGTSPANILSWSDTKIEASLSSTATCGSLAVFRSDKQIWSAPKSFFITTPPTSNNGITVTDVKVYDDATLQQMLDSARARLAGMQFLDQAGLAARIGTIQGATLQQSGFALNVGGPPIPGSQITANTGNTTTTQLQGTNTQANTGNTISTTSNGTNTQNSSTNASGAIGTGNQNTASTSSQLQVTGPSTVSTTSGSNQSQTVGPSQQAVTTLAQQNPVVPTLPSTTSFSLPSSFSPAASNLLNEQLELTYETTGLAMLLEGSLSDHYIQVATDGGSAQVIRRRATIGVPISLTPPRKYADCVAEVVLEVTTSDESILPQPPAVTAILPREKTYNVAAITESSVSIGGGVVTNVLSVGANWLWGHKTYYVVQDQDTVAIQLPPDPNHRSTTRVGWQIHPVLGQKTVQSGTRVLFVQLAFPVMPGAAKFGSVLVTTRWKKNDRKHNIVSSKPIDGSEVTMARRFSIPSFDVTPGIQDVDGPIDNGDGTVTVRVESEGYFAGTFVRIGTNALAAGSPNTLFEPSHISFAVSSSLLATHPAYLVDRSGAFREIRDTRVGALATPQCLNLGKVTAQPLNSSSALVTVATTISSESSCVVMSKSLKEMKPIAIIGNRVFGYRDAPMQSVTDDQISFLVPLDLLRASPYVTVKRVLWGPRFEDSAPVQVTAVPVIDKAVLTSKSATDIRIALMGSFLDGLQPSFPVTAKIEPVSSTAAFLVIPLEGVKDSKQAVLKSPSGDLLLVAMPSDIGSGPSLQAHAAIKSGQSATITVQGSGLDNFDHVECSKRKLVATLSGDKKSILVELPSSIVVPPAVELEFVFKKASSLTYSIEVFDTKVALPVQQAQPTPSTQPPQSK